MEADVIVPAESLRTRASVLECLACLFQVGLKDVTTKSATKRSVSTVTDTPLLSPPHRRMSFLAAVVFIKSPFASPFLSCSVLNSHISAPAVS